MATVINLSYPNQRLQYICTPREAVIAAYAQHLRYGTNSVGDWNTWDYEAKYGHLVEEGKHCLLCGDWSVFKDGRDF